MAGLARETGAGYARGDDVALGDGPCLEPGHAAGSALSHTGARRRPASRKVSTGGDPRKKIHGEGGD